MAARHVLTALAMLCGLGGTQGQAQEIDVHALYERACARCHAAHAGDFVFESLVLEGDTLVGKTMSMPVASMLANGHGKLTPEEAAALSAQLLSIWQGGQLFQEKCYICHQRAVVLSRLKLIVRDGRLVGRYTGRDIESFLAEHGRLTPEEVPEMLERLSAQLP